MKSLHVAVTANIKQTIEPGLEAPADALAEYDSLSTVEAIAHAISRAGHRTTIIDAGLSFVDEVRALNPDICFNIAEGLQGDSRESHVPAILEMLGIPYTGGQVLAHAISLDKAVTKQLWMQAGLPTAPFQVFRRQDESLHQDLTFPLFVKPIREGSGMGINEQSVVHNLRQLRHQVEWVLRTYRQPALVEDYLIGREFTVGLIGNTRVPGDDQLSPLYNELGYHLFPILEVDATVGVGKGLYNTYAKSFLPGEEGAPLYICPAEIDPSFAAELQHVAVKAFEAVGGLDVGRVDFKLGRYGRPYLLEVNTLPGLNPAASDLCIAARADGMAYEILIQEILNLALNRYGLV